jgi:predicted nucleotidyltransferase component of viral defense system
MDTIIREAQLKLLRTFAKESKTFALAGGTALELFYLRHRFSRDLDFFSPKYDLKEIDSMISKFEKTIEEPIKLENEFFTPDRAKVRFYVAKIKGTKTPVKIDFVEDVFFHKPTIKRFGGIPVYDVEEIYFQKIMALVGTRLVLDEVGREISTGRRAIRDVVDIYYLSKEVEALHKFMKKLSHQYQRGIIHWYRTYSRQETKLGVLDLEIYDKNFDVSGMIRYLDEEIEKFMHEVIE